MSSTFHRTPPLMVGDSILPTPEPQEAAPDNSEIESEAEDFGVEPERLSVLPMPEPNFPVEEDSARLRREAMNKALVKAARDRLNKRGSRFSVKNGRLGRVIGMWLSNETLDILGALSLDWEMPRTAVITQLVRQNKGATLKRWIPPAPGEAEKKQAWGKPEGNKRIQGYVRKPGGEE